MAVPIPSLNIDEVLIEVSYEFKQQKTQLNLHTIFILMVPLTFVYI